MDFKINIIIMLMSIISPSRYGQKILKSGIGRMKKKQKINNKMKEITTPLKKNKKINKHRREK